MPLTGPLQDEVEMALEFYDHYKGSIDSGMKLFCHESEDCFVTAADSIGLHNIVPDIAADRNDELINAILGADKVKNVANAMVRDSQGVLNAI